MTLVIMEMAVQELYLSTVLISEVYTALDKMLLIKFGGLLFIFLTVYLAVLLDQ